MRGVSGAGVINPPTPLHPHNRWSPQTSNYSATTQSPGPSAYIMEVFASQSTGTGAQNSYWAKEIKSSVKHDGEYIATNMGSPKWQRLHTSSMQQRFVLTNLNCDDKTLEFFNI